MKMLLTIGLPLVALGLLAGSIWYTPWRLSQYLGLERTWPLIAAFVAMLLLYLASMGLPHTTASPLVALLSNGAGLLFSAHVFLTLLLLLGELVRLVIDVPDRPLLWTVVGLTALLTAAGAWGASRLAVREVEIPMPGLDEDVVLVHISDVHIGAMRGRAWLADIVARTNAAEPDLVLLNGDLVDGAAALEPGVLDPLADLEAPAFFTTGNHEAYVDTDRVLELIAGHGVRVLHNEVVEVADLQLVGLDYMNADENTFDMHAVNALTIKEELPRIEVDRDRPLLLMHHSPVGLDYVAAAGVDLMVSGHTHAGQMFPATLFTTFIFPLNKGLYERNGTWFFVSEGAGTFGTRMRLGTRNEIQVITLKSS